MTNEQEKQLRALQVQLRHCSHIDRVEWPSLILSVIWTVTFRASSGKGWGRLHAWSLAWSRVPDPPLDSLPGLLINHVCLTKPRTRWPWALLSGHRGRWILRSSHYGKCYRVLRRVEECSPRGDFFNRDLNWGSWYQVPFYLAIKNGGGRAGKWGLLSRQTSFSMSHGFFSNDKNVTQI